MKVYVAAFSLLIFSSGVSPLYAQWVKTNGPDSVQALASGGFFLGGDVGSHSVLAARKDGVWGAHGAQPLTQVGTGLAGHQVTAVTVDYGRIHAGTESGKVFLLEGSSSSAWSEHGTGPGGFVRTLLAIGSRRLAAGTDSGFFVTGYVGDTWTWSGIWSKRNAGLTNTKVRVLTSLGPYVFAGTENGVFRSADTGVTWATTTTGLSTTNIRSFAVHGARLYAGTVGGGVFVSSDSGNVWTARNSGLGSLHVHALLAVQSNLYAGTDSGVYHSADSGVSWMQVNTGMGNQPIRSLAATGLTPNELLRLHAARDDGVWLRPLSDMQTGLRPSLHRPVAFLVDNPRWISFTLPTSSRVTLEAFTMGGRRAAVLLSEDLPAGAHARRLNTASLPSGLYFYRLRAGEWVETRKVMLSK